jgi:hypothetical protein
VKKKVAPKYKINVKCNDISSADENKQEVTAEYLKTIKRQYIYSSTEDSEVVLAFEPNNAGLKKLSSFV